MSSTSNNARDHNPYATCRAQRPRASRSPRGSSGSAMPMAQHVGTPVLSPNRPSFGEDHGWARYDVAHDDTSIADSTPLKLFAADATCPSYIATHCWGYSSINLCVGSDRRCADSVKSISSAHISAGVPSSAKGLRSVCAIPLSYRPCGVAANLQRSYDLAVAERTVDVSGIPTLAVRG